MFKGSLTHVVSNSLKKFKKKKSTGETRNDKNEPKQYQTRGAETWNLGTKGSSKNVRLVSKALSWCESWGWGHIFGNYQRMFFSPFGLLSYFFQIKMKSGAFQQSSPFWWKCKHSALRAGSCCQKELFTMSSLAKQNVFMIPISQMETKCMQRTKERRKHNKWT